MEVNQEVNKNQMICQICNKPKKRRRGVVCESCSKANYREKNRKKIAEKIRERYRTDPEYKANKLKYFRKYRADGRVKSSRNPEYDNAYTARQMQLKPWQFKAHKLVNNLIAAGKLTRQPCQICKKEKAVAHHCDYSKPLEVQWFCRSHHAAWHRLFTAESPTNLNDEILGK